MGLNLYHFLFVTLLLSGCLPKSNFKQNSEEITESDTGDTGDTGGDSVEPPTDTTLGITNGGISPVGTLSSPANSYYPKITGDVASTVAKVFVYTALGCPASSIAVEKDGSLLSDGIAGDDFDQMGVELDLSSTARNSTTKIYLKTQKTNGTFSACSHRYSYVHGIEAPIIFASLSLDGTTWLSANPPAASRNNNPKIKLNVSDDLVTRVQLYKGSCTGNVVEHPTATWVNTGVQFPMTEGTNRIYAKGLGESGYATACREIVQYALDTTPPTIAATIEHKFLSTSTEQSPEMNWTLSTDTGSGFSHYMYSIGTSAGATNVKGWTRTNDNTDFVVEGLSLTPETTYFMNIKSVDNAGAESAVRSSPRGWKVVEQNITFNITSPTAGQNVGSRTLTLQGTCIAGVEIRRTASTNIEGDSSFMCASDNTFNIGVLIKGTKLPTDDRTVNLVQSNGDNDVPDSVTVNYDPLSEYGTQLSSSTEHNCAVRGNELYCWGKGAAGKLGIASLLDKVDPQRIGRGGMGTATYEQVTTGQNFTCALNTSKNVYCWGSNNLKQLGQAAVQDNISKIPVYVGGDFVQISSGAKHTCGLKSNNQIACWGSNDNKELGPTSTGTTQYSPVAVSLPDGRTAVQVEAGANHSCARANTGEIFCWGHQQYGKLGNNVTANANLQGTSMTVALVQMINLRSQESFKYVSAGANHTCGLTNQDRVYCWGLDNNVGVLGINVSAVSTYAVPPTTSTNEYFTPNTSIKFRAVSAGGHPDSVNYQNTCAIDFDGRLLCWGTNESGQVGADRSPASGAVNRLTKASVPTLVNTSNVTGTVNFQEVSVGGRHVCAKNVDGEVYCWGLENLEVLGNANAAAAQLKPIKVINWPL